MIYIYVYVYLCLTIYIYIYIMYICIYNGQQVVSKGGLRRVACMHTALCKMNAYRMH